MADRIRADVGIIVAILAGLMFPLASPSQTPAQSQAPHPILPIGSSAPDFSLPGIDGKIHKLKDYSSSPIMAVLFTCVHCPTAQLYETRVQKLYDDYRNKGVAFVAINPNDPSAETDRK